MNKLLLACVTAATLVACGTTPSQSSTNTNQAKVSAMTKTPIVGAFLGAVMQQDPAKIRELANADYIQHNPFIPTGIEPFIQLLPVLKQNGTTAENIRMF